MTNFQFIFRFTSRTVISGLDRVFYYLYNVVTLYLLAIILTAVGISFVYLKGAESCLTNYNYISSSCYQVYLKGFYDGRANMETKNYLIDSTGRRLYSKRDWKKTPEGSIVPIPK